jgi:CTP-dependent riboflavin kinase
MIFPEMAGYPPDLLELISAAPVRVRLGLATGDVLTITVELPRA